MPLLKDTTAPVAVAARSQVVDHCVHNKYGVWQLAVEVVFYEGDDEVDVDCTISEWHERFIDNLYKDTGIVCRDTQKEVYARFCKRAISLTSATKAFRDELSRVEGGDGFVCVDAMSQVSILQRKKMESMAIVLADKLCSAAELLDEDGDEEESLFAPGVVPERPVAEDDLESCTDDDDVQSENERVVHTLDEALEEVYDPDPSMDEKEELEEESKCLMEDVTDITEAIQSVWEISDRIKAPGAAEAPSAAEIAAQALQLRGDADAGAKRQRSG
jgi:hypothetical protein